MNPISITVTGRLGDDPRTFTTRDGTDGVELRLAVDLPSRSAGGDGITRWVKVTAFGLLAEPHRRVGRQGRPGDRPGRRPDGRGLGRERQRRAPRPGHPAGPRDRRVDGLRQPAHRLRRPEGRTRLAAANGEPNDLPAGEQAEARVLSGVTTTS